MILVLLSFLSFLYAAEPMQCSVNSGPLKGQLITFNTVEEQVILMDKTNTRLICKKSFDKESEALSLNCGEGFFQSKIKILPDGLGSITTMSIESKINCETSTYLSLKGENQTKELSR